MWARKSTRPITKEFELINIATSPTRPSLSNVLPIVLEAYHCMSNNDWSKHDDVSIMLFPFNVYFIGSQLNSYFSYVDSFKFIWIG